MLQQNWTGTGGGGSSFVSIREDEYDSDPPPAYANIGPGPGPFRETAAGNGRYVVRDMERRRSFGIGGAGNIRTAKATSIVALSNQPLASLDLTTETPREQERRGSTRSTKSSTSSGANDLRDKIVDGVKTIISMGNNRSTGNHGANGHTKESSHGHGPGRGS